MSRTRPFRRIERRTIYTRSRAVLVVLIRKAGAPRLGWTELIERAAREAA